MEAVVEALVVTQFQPFINKQISSVVMAHDITERTLRHNVMAALIKFETAVRAEVVKEFETVTLGHHQREAPATDNNRALVLRAVNTVVAAWRTKATAGDVVFAHDLSRVQTQVAAVITSLSKTRTIETRTQNAARLEREAAAEEETAE